MTKGVFSQLDHSGCNLGLCFLARSNCRQTVKRLSGITRSDLGFWPITTVMVCRSNEHSMRTNENGPKIRPKLVERRGCSTRVLPCLRRSVARVTENAATMGVDMGRGIAVIDLVLHMYRRSPTRRKLAELWCVSRRLALRRMREGGFHRESFGTARRIARRPPNPSALSPTRPDLCTRRPRPIGVVARADRTRFIAPAPA